MRCNGSIGIGRKRGRVKPLRGIALSRISGIGKGGGVFKQVGIAFDDGLRVDPVTHSGAQLKGVNGV